MMKINKRMIIFIGITSMLILGILILLNINEGEEKESLLNFTCEELSESKISTDGKDGMFVTDICSYQWVNDGLITRAYIKKDCENLIQLEDLEEFNYKNG